MINIPIGENASIIQPYYDGGESYVGHHKYSLVNKYKVVPEGNLSQNWCAFIVKVQSGGTTVLDYEDTEIDISEYNRFRIFGVIPKEVHVAVYCNDELVLDEQGNGTQGFTDTQIRTTQQLVKKLRYVFQNEGENDSDVTLFYLGMLNDKQTVKNPYTAEWEGCFSDTPQYGLYNELYVTQESIDTMREKIKSEPYKSEYQKLREEAEQLMQLEPEQMISKTIQEYHRGPMLKLVDAGKLAVCGQLEQNEDMLRMACRYALSLACCENWCADAMELAQTITWHHRSFTETDALTAVSAVIALAGGVLSWHGRNLLYNAIIMKGLPRVEADFMTMEYIYKCNQGIAFMKGYLLGVVTLIQQYPRYKLRYEEAKLLLDEMYDNCIEPDGGYKEGAAYWNYMMLRYLECQYVIARYEKKNICEVVGEKLLRTGDFGIANLDEEAQILTINDSARHGHYTTWLTAAMYAATGREEWAEVYHKNKQVTPSAFATLDLEPLDIPKQGKPFLKEYVCYESVGLTVCNRESVQFAVTGGPSNDTHAHCDKGSFLISVNAREAVPDFCCSYVEAECAIESYSASHSLTLPVINGKVCEQKKGEGIEAPVICSEYVDGRLRWKCDLTTVWKAPGLKSAVREIVSSDKCEYIITDSLEFTEKGAAEVRINLAPDAPIEIIPQNWTPIKEEMRTVVCNERQTVYQKILSSEEGSSLELITKVVVK